MQISRSNFVVVVVLMLTLLSSGAGCRALVELIETDPGGSDVDGGPIGDGGDGVDGPPGCQGWTFVPAHFDPCDLPSPEGDLVLGTGIWTYNTDTGVLLSPDQMQSNPASELANQNGGPEVRVVSVDAFSVDAEAELLVTGSRALVLASWSTIVVDGIVNVGGSLDQAGAGGNPGDCLATTATVGADFADGAGGGGGGGFGEAGAAGGTGRDMSAAGGLGGTAVNLPVLVRGGCSGAKGGNLLGGNGGGAGGAIQLTARISLDLSGRVLAGGGGGRGSGGSRSGGGGGGAGGMIDLQAPVVTLRQSAILAANGGGGGGGSDNNPAGDGRDGRASESVADGGDNEGMGDDGGAGGARGIAASPGEDSSRGGGGGGGGVGFVVLHAVTLMVDPDAKVSPDPLAP